MQFTLSEDEHLLRQMLRDFALKKIAPGAIARDAQAAFPHEIIPEMAALKLLGITIPEVYGGAGLNTLALAIVLEEVAAVDASLALILASHNSLCTSHLYRFGNERQREGYVVPLAKGEILGAWALTEAGSGSDAAAMSTNAVLSGDEWIINGSKLFITQGSTAGIYLIMARTDFEKGKNGISAFIVEKGTPGLTIGKAELKLGVRASDTAALYFENIRIPKENLLGNLNEAYGNVLSILDGGRIGIAAMALGLARAALMRSITHAKTRSQFGKKLGSFQAIQSKLSDMSTEIDAARLLIYQAAFFKDAGKSFRMAASEAKLFASEVANRVTNQAIQIHGGSGLMQEAEVERYFRDMKLCEIGEGTSEIQRMVIAKNLLQ